MRKLILLVSCMVAVFACSNPSSSPDYLSGTHQVHYTVALVSGAFTVHTLNVVLQTSPYGTTPDDSIDNLDLPYSSSTYSMNFTGADAYLAASGEATASTAPATLTMSIWIDGVKKYTSTSGIGAAMGATATVTVQSPRI